MPTYKKQRKSHNATNLTKTKPRASYVSLFYGILTGIALLLVIFIGINLFLKEKGEVTDQAQNTQVNKRVYKVLGGDSLWSIAEKTYNDPYKWTEIAKTNKIANPNIIEKGMKLTIPEISKPEVRENLQGAKITGSEYQVLGGDSLWTIAVRAYADGYRWPEIARANNLVNPDTIHRGNKLKLPR